LPKKEKQKQIDLLPPRMKATMRLYGVSPLVLLKRRDSDIKTKAKVNSFRHAKSKGEAKAKEEDGVNDSSRLDGPEIAPGFGEANEFENIPDQELEVQQSFTSEADIAIDAAELDELNATDIIP
jgi:hypothetical protein